MKPSNFSNLGIKPFKKGLIDLGEHIYCYLQPDGGWGWSNAGLVTDGDESLIVDTLFDEDLTYQMLKTMKKAEPKAIENPAMRMRQIKQELKLIKQIKNALIYIQYQHCNHRKEAILQRLRRTCQR